MKTRCLFQVFFFLALIATKGLFAANGLQEKANQYYMDRDYNNALKAYTELLAANQISADILYNIGNCHYNMGQLGKAIVYYERASRLNPDDEDISFNLKLAGLKTVDKIETVPPIIYKRWFQAVSGTLTVSQWSIVLIILIWLGFVAWSWYLFSSTVAGKKTSFVVASALSALCVIVFLFVHETYSEAHTRQYGVVLSASSYVKSAPDERGNDQFILHEGTRLEVLDELGEWKKIRIANGSVGWLKGNSIEVI